MDDAQLRTVWQQRQPTDTAEHLSQPLALFLKHTLAKRVRQLCKLAKVWDEVIPESIAVHTALETFHQGVLTVVVDSAPYRFQLQTLLRGGLMRELQARFDDALNKVRIIPGQFYSIDLAGLPRFGF